MITMKRSLFNWKYVITLIGFLLLASLMMNFNNRIAELRRLTVQREAVAARLEGLEQTQTSLKTQIAYATSEAAVIDWAYQEGSMVRSGDIPVVPVEPADSTPVPTPTPIVTRPVVKSWQMWLWLFFDTDPVNF